MVVASGMQSMRMPALVPRLKRKIMAIAMVLLNLIANPENYDRKGILTNRLLYVCQLPVPGAPQLVTNYCNHLLAVTWADVGL